MSTSNGHALETPIEPSSGEAPPAHTSVSAGTAFSPEQLAEIFAALEVPFETSLIKWRVVETNKSQTRGRVFPYADWRAYTDRLNQLLTPGGWTRELSIGTSANFQEQGSRKINAKVFVTCKLTLHGINAHSSTGEQWADDQHSGTSAEAQASRRAASQFGLGLYLYRYPGMWVSLDRNGQPTKLPELPAWATPESWRNGLRPPQPTSVPATSSEAAGAPKTNSCTSPLVSRLVSVPRDELLRRIQTFKDPLGRIYQGLLKTVAKKYRPRDIATNRLLATVLLQMEAAARGLKRLDAALDVTGPEAIGPVLDSLNLESVDKVDNLKTLHALVSAMENKAGTAPKPN